MKTYRMEYRQRVFLCKKCKVYLEFLGQGPLGKCPCCDTPLRQLPKELDNMVSVKRTVTPLRSDAE